MNIENELKYVINELPCNLNEPYQIIQYYFDPRNLENDLMNIFKINDLSTITTFRLRLVEHLSIKHNYLTLKSKGLLSRKEYEVEIDDKMKNKILKQPIISTIVKNRYIIKYDEYNFEFDEYLNLGYNLFTVEIEFKSDMENNKRTIEMILDKYFKLKYKDVTFDPSYKNSNLLNRKRKG